MIGEFVVTVSGMAVTPRTESRSSGSFYAVGEAWPSRERRAEMRAGAFDAHPLADLARRLGIAQAEFGNEKGHPAGRPSFTQIPAADRGRAPSPSVRRGSPQKRGSWSRQRTTAVYG